MSLMEQFQESKDSKKLFQSFCQEMSKAREWQGRLRYCLALHFLITQLHMHEEASQNPITAYTENLQSIRGRMPTNLKSYNSSGLLERKINQYLVQPFYNYLLRISFSGELLQRQWKQQSQPTTAQMFKMVNLINMLIEMRQPCRFLLSSFANVFLVEQLILVLFDQMTSHYKVVRQGLEYRIENFENSSSPAELDIILNEISTIHKKIQEFRLLFDAFCRPCQVVVPAKPQINKNKLRQLRKTLTTQQLIKTKSQQSCRTIATNSKQIIEKYIQKAIYEEDASNIYEQSRIQEEGRFCRKFVQDDTDVRMPRKYSQEVESD